MPNLRPTKSRKAKKANFKEALTYWNNQYFELLTTNRELRAQKEEAEEQLLRLKNTLRELSN